MYNPPLFLKPTEHSRFKSSCRADSLAVDYTNRYEIRFKDSSKGTTRQTDKLVSLLLHLRFRLIN